MCNTGGLGIRLPLFTSVKITKERMTRRHFLEAFERYAIVSQWEKQAWALGLGMLLAGEA